nr:cytochrome c oxidase subunit III [Brachionus calyciflorus]
MAVQSSFWPFLVSLVLFSLMSNLVLWFHLKLSFTMVLFPGLLLVTTKFLWWKDLNRESMIGYHTHKLEDCLIYAVLSFHLWEVFGRMFIFWAFYDASLSPANDDPQMADVMYSPHKHVYIFKFLMIMIMYISGITVTWAHHSIMNNYFNKSVFSLGITVVLGDYFLFMQWVQYNEAQFSIADGVYGSTFFMATGFHGMHVMVRTIFLFYVLLNLLDCKLLYNHHFSFEAAAWYWHFADVVWLILFISIYWWGSL